VNILGISAFYHDSAAALVQDGVLIAAAEEERFSRRKHDAGFPKLAAEFCLKRGGIAAKDLDWVVFYEKPFVKFERIFQTAMATFPRGVGVFRAAMQTWLMDKLWIKAILREELGVDPSKIAFCDHHLAHAASSYYCSPFEKAAVLTIDGVLYGSTYSGDMDLTWEDRNRLTDGDNLLGTAESGTNTRETNQSVTVKIYTTAGTLKRTASGITTGSYTYTEAMEVADFGAKQASLRVDVYSVRDGLESQVHSLIVSRSDYP